MNLLAVDFGFVFGATSGFFTLVFDTPMLLSIGHVEVGAEGGVPIVLVFESVLMKEKGAELMLRLKL